MDRFDDDTILDANPDLVVENINQNSNNRKEYRRIYYKSRLPDRRIIIFAIGFCLGIIFFCVQRDVAFDIVGDIGDGKLAIDGSDTKGLLLYIAGIRLKQLIFCEICALGCVGGFLAYALLGVLGFEGAVVLFTLSWLYKMQGFTIAVLMFFPHGIFYLIIYLIIFNKYWSNDTKYYCENTKGKIKSLQKAALIGTIFFIAIICEYYVNTKLMQKVIFLFN